MKRKAHTTIYQEESKLFYTAIFSCLLVVAAYMYFVSLSVVHVVVRQEIDREIRTLTTEVGVLEATYIEKQHAVSNDVATLKGFVMADRKIFIDKGGDTLVLSGN